MGLGWRTWDVKARKEEEEWVKAVGKATRKAEGKKKAAETRRLNRLKKIEELAAMTPDEKSRYLLAEKAKRAAAARKAAATRAENKRKKQEILMQQ